MEKVSFIDNEPAFRWALFDDTMAFDKVCLFGFTLFMFKPYVGEEYNADAWA